MAIVTGKEGELHLGGQIYPLVVSSMTITSSLNLPPTMVFTGESYGPPIPASPSRLVDRIISHRDPVNQSLVLTVEGGLDQNGGRVGQVIQVTDQLLAEIDPETLISGWADEVAAGLALAVEAPRIRTMLREALGISDPLTPPYTSIPHYIWGWRFWAISYGWLVGMHDVPWPSPHLTAVCRHRHDRTPALGCRCGIYLNKDAPTTSSIVFPSGRKIKTLYGYCRAWGVVVEHEHGYRAEHVECVALLPGEGDLGDLPKEWQDLPVLRRDRLDSDLAAVRDLSSTKDHP